ncbi:hypothetical protein [Nocardia thraciensis]
MNRSAVVHTPSVLRNRLWRWKSGGIGDEWECRGLARVEAAVENLWRMVPWAMRCHALAVAAPAVPVETRSEVRR